MWWSSLVKWGLTGPNSDILCASAYLQLPTTFTVDLTLAQVTIFEPWQTQVVCNLTDSPAHTPRYPVTFTLTEPTSAFFCLHQPAFTHVYHLWWLILCVHLGYGAGLFGPEVAVKVYFRCNERLNQQTSSKADYPSITCLDIIQSVKTLRTKTEVLPWIKN